MEKTERKKVSFKDYVFGGVFDLLMILAALKKGGLNYTIILVLCVIAHLVSTALLIQKRQGRLTLGDAFFVRVGVLSFLIIAIVIGGLRLLFIRLTS